MLLRNLSRIMPAFMRNKYRNLLKYCDIGMDAEKFVGLSVLLSIILAIIVPVNLGVILSLSNTKILLAGVGIFFGMMLVTYLWLVLKADSKGKYIENILPDALLLMAMNIKSGMTSDRALIMAARPEFGALEKELNHAGRQVLGGKLMKQALLEMADRVRSPVLDRTIHLIVEGIESGGELSNLLEQTAVDIQNTKIIRAEVQAAVLMYAIFIFFASSVGAPLLFGISTYLVSAITKQSALYAVDTGSVQQTGFGIGSGLGNMAISPDTLVLFALMSLTVTSFFAGLIIGAIKDGNEKAGLKLIPILWAISIGVFFAVRGFVSSVLAI